MRPWGALKLDAGKLVLGQALPAGMLLACCHSGALLV